LKELSQTPEFKELGSLNIRYRRWGSWGSWVSSCSSAKYQLHINFIDTNNNHLGTICFTEKCVLYLMRLNRHYEELDKIVLCRVHIYYKLLNVINTEIAQLTTDDFQKVEKCLNELYTYLDTEQETELFEILKLKVHIPKTIGLYGANCNEDYVSEPN
jgi:hypothetical protein